MIYRSHKFLILVTLLPLASIGAYGEGAAGKPSSGSADPAARAPIARLAQAAPLSVQALDEFFSAFCAANRIPGLSVAVVQDGQLSFARGYGSDGLGRPMSPETRLCVGSVSKSFTALAVLQLERRGLLDLDAPYARYVPWFAVDGEGAERITVRHLLTHTSGLDETGDPQPELPDASLEDEVGSLARVRPSAAPGTRFVYYNKNYRALGYLVEILGGQPFGVYMRERIFEPLGMAGATLDPAGIAVGTAPFFGLPLPVPNTYFAGDAPSGGLVMSAVDAAKYLAALMDASNFIPAEDDGPSDRVAGSPPIASSGAGPDGGPAAESVVGRGFIESLRSVPEGVDSNYGLGWRIERGGARLVHGGDVSGFHAYAELNMDTGVGCVVLCRQNGLALMLGAHDQLPLDVHALLAGEPASDPRAYAWLPFIPPILGVIAAAYHAWRFAALPSWFRKAMQRPSRRRVALAIVPIVPAACLLCLPWLFTAALGLACTWSDLFHFLPDLTLVLVAGAIATLVRAAARLLGLAKRPGQGTALAA